MLSDRTPVAIVDFFSTGFRDIWTSLPLSHPIIFGPWSLTSLDVVILSTFRTLVQTSYRALRVLPQCLKLPGTPGVPQYLKLSGIPGAPQPLLGHPGFYEKNKAGGKTRGARRHAAIRVSYRALQFALVTGQTSFRALRVLPQYLKLPGTPGAPQPLLGHPGF